MTIHISIFHLFTLHEELLKGHYNPAYHVYLCTVFEKIQDQYGQTFKKIFAPRDTRDSLEVFSGAISNDNDRKRISKIFLQIADNRLAQQKKD